MGSELGLLSKFRYIFFDLLSTVTLAVLMLDLTARGYLPSWLAAIMLVVFVAFRAFARAVGGVADLVHDSFTILFLLILIVILILKAGWLDIAAILIGTFYRGLEQILAVIMKLVGRGYIPLHLAVLLSLVLVFLRWVGRGKLGSKLIYLTFRIAAPIFVLTTFLSTASHGNLKEAVVIGCSLLALTVMLEGFYLMFYGLFQK